MLDKIFAIFAYPLGMVMVGLIVAAIAVVLGARKTGLSAIFTLCAVLWAVSTPIMAHWMTAQLESEYPPSLVSNYRPADVIIVLGGALSPPGNDNPYADLGEASDRAVHAYRIFKAALAPKILVSGGNVFPDGRVSEGEAIADLLAEWGIDRSAIIIEGNSRNTFENAQQSADVWKKEGFRSGLLVTSALHMPRALAVFRKAGLSVEPASTDFRSGDPPIPFPLSILPDARSLEESSLAIKEWIGLFVYRWRGWA